MRPTTICSKCNLPISNNNLKRHEKSCEGKTFRSFSGHCPECTFTGSKQSVAAHWYHTHSDRNQYEEDRKKMKTNMKVCCGRKAWNRGLTASSSPLVKRISEKTSGRKMSGEEYRNLVERCKSDEHKKASSRGGKAKTYTAGGRGKGAWTKDSDGKEVYLQSSYEIEAARLLNEAGIHWTRPAPLSYELDGKRYRYYPDFLLKSGIYLDPKNDYLITKDARKIQTVMEQNKCQILVLGWEKLNLAFISSLS